MFYDILKQIKFLFKPNQELYLFFYNLTGFYPRNINLYIEALTHRSAGKRTPDGKVINNERLEFLGDSIIDAAIAHILFERFPDSDEGFLTSTRAKIVQREHLNKVGTDLGLKVEASNKSKTNTHNSYMCGNALEALVGAIYLDLGYDAAHSFIANKIIDRSLEEFAKVEVNYKSKLIEWGQKYRTTIEFELISTTNDHTNSPVFRSAVVIGGVYVSEGVGFTKKESHQVAAHEAYDLMMTNPTLRNRVLNERLQ